MKFDKGIDRLKTFLGEALLPQADPAAVRDARKHVAEDARELLVCGNKSLKTGRLCMKQKWHEGPHE